MQGSVAHNMHMSNLQHQVMGHMVGQNRCVVDAVHFQLQLKDAAASAK